MGRPTRTSPQIEDLLGGVAKAAEVEREAAAMVETLIAAAANAGAAEQRIAEALGQAGRHRVRKTLGKPS